MHVFLIGHRGTGKTTLLQRFQIYGRGGFPVFDLDREIEKRTGEKVDQIFAQQGEESYRRLEIETLDQLIKSEKNMVCALGAGFPLHAYALPPKSEILWVRRASDSVGRIFLDRPRLNAQVSALDEYAFRFVTREAEYAKQADWVYLLPEGLVAPNEIERKILGNRLEGIGGILTLRPDHFRNPQVFRERIARMGVDYFELRSDMLNEAELRMAISDLPPQKILVSIRKAQIADEWHDALKRSVESDWALELGEKAWGFEPTIISLHKGLPGEDLMDQVQRLQPYEDQGLHVKWSPEIETFADLNRAMDWQQEKPQRRSLLPRSKQGRWAWVRLILKDRQKLNFFRDGDGSAADQPTLHEWLRSPGRATKFAAVLGSPVGLSYSPTEHSEFVSIQGLPFFAIDVQANEWDQALPILEDWGLQYAAITAPLKIKACESAKEKSPEAIALHSVNTFTALETGGYRGHNTDLLGFREMNEAGQPVTTAVIWGGGGTLPVIKSVLPEALAYSVRTAAPRDPVQDPIENPQTLIWAAPPTANAPEFSSWKPQQVFDLNYREDSRAREYALKVGARYLSGLVMFKAQAEAQREEWEFHGK